MTHQISLSPACQLAGYLLQKPNRAAGETVNVHKLNALLYYAEACALVMNAQSLLQEGLEAWDHGPAVASVWQQLKHRGWNALTAEDLASNGEQLDEDSKSLLDDVWQAYGEYSWSELQKMLKQDEPWKQARRGLKDWDLTKRPIDTALLASCYQAVFAGESHTAVQRPERHALAGLAG